MTDPVRYELCKSKVGHLGSEIGVEEDAAGLDVPMYNVRSGLVMQITSFIICKFDHIILISICELMNIIN